MAISVFDLFKVGIGPSSSHTVGPMKAAGMFARGLRDDGLLPDVDTVRVALYGSLGLTGPGHGSDKAVLLGLEGEEPATVDVDAIPGRLEAIKQHGTLRLLGEHEIPFTLGKNLEFNRRKKLGYHPNGMRFTACGTGGATLRERDYYSIGGGFVTDETQGRPDQDKPGPEVPYPFTTGEELLGHARSSGLPVSGIMLANEQALGRTSAEILAGLAGLWQVMQACVERGCRTDGMLPGGLKVPRRAPRLFRQLTCERDGDDPLRAMDWVTLYALAVNEENAAGGRVVTAPTNGGRHRPRRAALLRPVRARRVRQRRRPVPADRDRHRDPVQGERVHLRRRGRLPGRGGVGLLDGGRRAGRAPRRHAGAGGERRGDRHRAQPGADL